MNVKDSLKLLTHWNDFLFQYLLIDMQEPNITLGNETFQNVQLINVTLTINIQSFQV